MPLCVHDEIILSVAKADAKEAAERLERVMAEAFLRMHGRNGSSVQADPGEEGTE